VCIVLDFSPSDNFNLNLKCYLVAAHSNIKLRTVDDIGKTLSIKTPTVLSSELYHDVSVYVLFVGSLAAPRLPAIRLDNKKSSASSATIVFGATAVATYLSSKAPGSAFSAASSDLLDIDEHELSQFTASSAQGMHDSVATP
jgi:hypothetical protein